MAEPQRWKQIAFLFAVPVIAGAIFQFELQYERSDWMDAVRKDFPGRHRLRPGGAKPRCRMCRREAPRREGAPVRQ